MTHKEKVEKLWRKAGRERWDYKKYCDHYHALMRGEEEKDD